ncbi:MAG TPA: hypothetical protein VGN12_12795 [Pirellulales bacterium]|jgi:hypothetical protein
MRRTNLLLCVCALLSIQGNALATTLQLYDGTDLNGFTVHGPATWSGAGGILQNTDTADAESYLTYDTPLSSDSFFLQVQVTVLEGMRFRLHGVFDQLYIGNEGFIRQFEMYGSQLTNSQQVSDDSYLTDVSYTLRLEKDADGDVRLYQDGVLTHTGDVGALPDLNITILAGDDFSPGKIQITSLTYGSLVPEPSAVAPAALGGLILLAAGIQKRRRCPR